MPVGERPALARGDLVHGRYRVGRRVGIGGMGEVYRAEDLSDGRPVALKVVQPALLGSAKTRRRFDREVEMTGRVDHPNVVRLLDFFELAARRPGETARPCLVMEFLDGETLADRLSEAGQLAPSEIEAILRQVAAGLDAAHAAGIVHRDLKPDNIFLVRDAADALRVVVTDFGVARGTGLGFGDNSDDSGVQSQTATGVLLGTPDYMAPEQLELETALPQSDLYALGLIAFEALAGRPPFLDGAPLEVLFRRVEEPAPPLSDFVERCPPPLERVVARCLELEPEARYERARDLVADLDGEGESRWSIPRLRIDTGHWVALGVVLGLLAGIAGLVVLSVG
ncbi:MAG: serine/threonine-protein kinase [Acidobacteriota bacterium]